MPLTAVLCCCPQSVDDIVFAGGREPLITVALKHLVDNGTFHRVVISTSNTLFMDRRQALERLGLDVHYSHHTASQRRLHEVMEDLCLDKACILNGYSFLIDPDQTARLETRRETTGKSVVFADTQSPFRYQCLIDRAAVRRLADAHGVGINPLKLHHALPVSDVCSDKRCEMESLGIDGFFWLVLVHAMQSGQEDTVRAIRDEIQRGTPPLGAVDVTLQRHGLDLSGKGCCRDQAEVYKICKLIREYFSTQRSQIQAVRKGRFLELGFGDAPYAAFLHAMDFTEGIAIEPFSYQGHPGFVNNTETFAQLLPGLADLLPGFRLPRVVSDSVTFLNQFLHECGFEKDFFDFCFSTTVLEHVEDVPSLMCELHRVMCPGSAMLHVVDYGGHSFCKENRFPFYSCPKATWMRRSSYLNLLRRSEVIGAIEDAGFAVTVLREEQSILLPTPLDDDWRQYSEQDLTTVTGAYWCVKK